MAGRGGPKDDGFSGLLSGLSGIDAGLFNKNESMAAAKSRKTLTPPTPAATFTTGAASSVKSGLNGTPASGYSQPAAPSRAPGAGQHSSTAGAAPSLGPRQQANGQGSGDPFLATQLDAFGGLNISSSASRPMNAGPARPAASASPAGFSSTPPAYAGSAGSGSVANGGGDDFDLLFGGSGSRASAPASGAPSAATGSTADLVDLGFGGTGMAPTADALADDLFGMSSLPQQPASTGRSVPNAASPATLDDGLDLFSTPAPAAPAPGSALPHAGSGTSLDAAAEYNRILQQAHSRSGARSSSGDGARSSATAAADFPTFEKPSHRAPQGAAHAGQAASPPLQPAGGGTGGGTFFDQYGAEDALAAPHSSASRGSMTVPRQQSMDHGSAPPPPAYDDVLRPQHSAASGGGPGGAHGGMGMGGLSGADVKKQAEKLGKSFLSGAKKLAKAAQQKAKEVQAKLEEMDREGRLPHFGPGHFHQHGERFDDVDGSYSHSRPSASQPRVSGEGSIGRAVGAGREEDVPAHYYEWASSVVAITSVDERCRFLEALPDHEREVLLRLLRQQGVPDPFEQRLQRQERQRDEAAGTYTPPSAASRPQTAPTPSSPRESRQQSRPPTAASAAPRPAPAPAADLLGMDDGASASHAPPPAAAAATRSSHAADMDLLGLSGAHQPTASASPSAPASAAPAPSASVASLDDFFGSASASSSNLAAAATQRHDDIAAMFGEGPGQPSGGAGGAFIDFGDAEDVSVDGHEHLYTVEQGLEGEPEQRRQARLRREAEKHARMQAKLAEKRQAEQAEAAEKEAKVSLREQYKPAVDKWAHQKKDNIRALLSSVHTVLWEDSGWKAPGMADIVDAQKVKRWYMKANLIVHPDKVKQKGGTIEQVTLADMIFDVLKQAYAQFEQKELR